MRLLRPLLASALLSLAACDAPPPAAAVVADQCLVQAIARDATAADLSLQRNDVDAVLARRRAAEASCLALLACQKTPTELAGLALESCLAP